VEAVPVFSWTPAHEVPWDRTEKAASLALGLDVGECQLHTPAALP
jgi:hypothetical protein